MRRTFALTAVALTLALAGCSGTPSGGSGKIVGEWPVLPSASPATPVAGTCHYYGTSRDFESSLREGFSFTEPADIGQTRDCVPADSTADAGVHDTETAYVGTFTGTDAQGATPPAAGSQARRSAYAVCQTKVNGYLGGDWHETGVWIMLVLPPDVAWRDGARWYRCDIGRLDNPAAGGIVVRGSVRDGLTGDRPLAVTCLTTNENSAGEIVYTAPVDCDKPHAAEYAGFTTARSGDFPATQDKANALAQDNCAEVVARYLGFASAASWDNAAIGYMSVGFDEERWEMGDRSARCFAYAFTKSKVIIGSVKGIRGRTPRS